MLLRCLPLNFPSIQLTVREQITIEDLQDSRRRFCSKIFKKADNFINSESLCRFDASKQVLTQSDLWFGRICRLKNFKMAAMGISERKDFSNSESLCHCDVSHQLLVQSNLRFRRRCQLKNFKMASMAAILDIGTTLAILNLYVAPMPPIKFWLNPSYGLGGDVV